MIDTLQRSGAMNSTDSLMTMLSQLARQGNLRQLDYQFGRFIASQAKTHQDELGFLATMLSHELGKGHICLHCAPLPYAQLCDGLNLYGERAQWLMSAMERIDWLALLNQSALVGRQGQSVPLIIDNDHLYLHRYWHYETQLAQRLTSLSAPIELDSVQKKSISQSLSRLFQPTYGYLFAALQQANKQGESSQVLRQQLVCDHLDVVDVDALDWQAIDELLVSASNTTQLNELERLVPMSTCLSWQKVAAAVALTRRFAVISGGPGTGKTTTVTKLLSALVEQGTQNGAIPSIKLVAPTGKAAARLTESIGAAIGSLPIDPHIKQYIPTQSSTLHRLLGAMPNRAEFRYNESNPLHLDVLVVDEASMIDLSMMYKLVSALPAQARLILLGDKDQLASVEAGAVLGDICSFNQYGFSREQSHTLAAMTGYASLMQPMHNQTITPQSVTPSLTQSPSGLADSLCVLQKSYRFDARSGIGQLAKAINSGFANNVDKVLAKGFVDIEVLPRSSEHYHRVIQRLVTEYGGYLDMIYQPATDADTSAQFSDEGLKASQDAKAKAVLKAFSQCRLLCAVREGDYGVNGFNERIERALAAKRYIAPNKEELWYQGRPIMVSQNDHALGLFNGDIGICMLDGEGEGARLKVYFEMPDGTIKSVLPSRVPEHETAYAMTIHKSQGSEFALTIMVLPPVMSPVLTKELVYTGVTRAKKQLMLLSDLSILKRAVRLATERRSGLAARLQ